MKILHLHNSYRQPGGEDTIVQAERELLQAGGHELVAVDTENPTSRGAAAARFAVSAWNPVSAQRVRRLVVQHAPDIAHVHNTWYSLTSSVVSALKSLGVPVVMTLHNYRFMCSNALLFRAGGPCELCVGSHPMHGIRYRCYRDSLVQSIAVAGTIAANRKLSLWAEAVDRFLVLTDFARQRFVAAGFPRSKLVLHANSVLDAGPRLRPPSQADSLLFVGRITPEKGLGFLLDSWRDHGPPCRLRVLGDGPQLASLRGRAGPGVTLVGRCSKRQVRSEMRNARALVVPSQWYEGQPAVVLEAFAAGLPVIASDIGGLAETVGPLGSDWLVDPTDSHKWANLDALIVDERRLDNAGVKARRLYEQYYRPAVAYSRLIQNYAEVTQAAE